MEDAKNTVFEDLEDGIMEDDIDFPVKNKARSARRKKDVTKALRKRNIGRTVHDFEWYDNLHQYSKNKIHCSCPMCRFKSKYTPDNKPMSDKRKLVGMAQREKLWDRDIEETA